MFSLPILGMCPGAVQSNTRARAAATPGLPKSTDDIQDIVVYANEYFYCAQYKSI